MFNLDTLFESYTHISERGRSRGIYLTAWNIPFVVVPILTSTLSVSELPIVYFISSLLLLPFLFLIFYHIKNPEIFIDTSNNLIQKLKGFFKDKLEINLEILTMEENSSRMNLSPGYMYSKDNLRDKKGTSSGNSQSP